MTFSSLVAPKGAVCVTCLSVILALQEFCQMINFHFTRTTEHQPTRNLHSFAQVFGVTSTATHFQAYFSAMCDKIPQNLQVLAQ